MDFPFLTALPWEITEIRGLSLTDLKSLLTFLRPAVEQNKKQNTTLRLVAFADLSGVNIPAWPILSCHQETSGQGVRKRAQLWLLLLVGGGLEPGWASVASASSKSRFLEVRLLSR